MTARPTDPPATGDAPGAARDGAAAATVDALGGYCRRCGYALRGLASRACPECGRAFDPADPRTVARRPPRRALWRWARRVGVVALVMLVAGAAGVGWLWRDWRGEQAARARLRAEGAIVVVEPIGPEWLRRHWPARSAHWFDRAGSVSFWINRKFDLETVDWASLRRLRVLGLNACAVPGPAVERLRALKRLECLDLSGSKPDSPAYRALASLPAIDVLRFRNTGTTDADLTHVRQMIRLRVLDLSINRFGDAGVAHLSGLGQLEFLDLRDNRVTDVGLDSLHGLFSLRKVDLRGTAVTDEGVRRLRAALPNAKIVWPN